LYSSVWPNFTTIHGGAIGPTNLIGKWHLAPAAEAEHEHPAEEAAAPAPEPEPAARTYTVESGDTLWAISERFYGDGSKYQVIADASGISNPDLIQPGQVLTIP